VSGAQLLISLIVVTVGWQLMAQAAGPPLAQWLYRKKVEDLRGSGLQFESREAVDAWAVKASTDSMNVALLALAAGCGLVAGIIGYPLIGISRSTNGWSWARVLTLCGTSWLAMAVLHPGSF